MKMLIYHSTSILHGLITTHKRPTPNISGFIAQLVRALHRYREVTGSNPVEVLTFSGFYTQLLCLNCVQNCDDHSLLDFKYADQYMKHFIYHFTILLFPLDIFVFAIFLDAEVLIILFQIYIIFQSQ